MASRCINALNNLDQISEKIFYKHSKSRFKAEVEARLKASKARTDRSSLDLDEGFSRSSFGPTNSHHSTSTRAHSRSSFSNKRATKSAINARTTQERGNMKQQRVRTTKSCPESLEEKSENVENPTPPSVFGRHTPGQERYEPTTWFNFENGSSTGVIDSFACDANEERALCYAVDSKQAKPVPKLLRHRLEVRIGQNGNVKTAGHGKMESENTTSVRQKGKARPAPLSWEEQLNWQNANVVSPKPPTPNKTQDEGLCETHPVIFHPREKKPSVKTNEDVNTSTAYRMHLETRRLVADRGNLTCSEKFITSVELEDASEENLKAKKCREEAKREGVKTEDVDDDRMDMSNTINNIERLYSRTSASSEGEMMAGLSKRDANGVKMLEKSVVKVEDQSRVEDKRDELSYVEGKRNEFEKQDKIIVSKRVSFEDQQWKANISKQVISSDRPKEEMLNEDDTKAVSRSYEMSGIQNTIEELKHFTKPRPKSSRDRLESPANSEIFEKLNLSRPCTAPPTSPRISFHIDIGKDFFEIGLRSPIRVPTSERENASETEDGTEQCPVSGGENVSKKVEENQGNEIQVEVSPKLRVSMTCKSAPTTRVTPRKEAKIERSKSSMLTNRKREYTPPKPVAVYSESSMELPKNLPPAKALIELRKKIREDLAKQTADLQLDIQQLYLKQHNESLR